jgi:hypothetical protein
VLDDLLRLNAEAVEALEPAAQEALEAVASAVRTGVGARTGFVPLDIRIEQLEHDRQITTVESVVAAPECLDVRARHSGPVHQAQALSGPRSEASSPARRRSRVACIRWGQPGSTARRS